MDNALKQRILGVIVLFALIGICITVLLHNNKKAQQEGIPTTSSMQPTRHHRNQTLNAQNALTTQTTQTKNIDNSNANPTQPSTSSVFGNPPPATTATTIRPHITSTPTSTQTTRVTPMTATTTTPRHNTQLLETVPSPVKLQPTRTLTTKPEHTTPITKTKTFEKNTKEISHATTSKAFAVQVGTFSNRENATALVKALKGRGFTATTSTFKTKHGTMTRVLIGERGLTRKQAETTRTRINETFQIKGIITPITQTKTTRTETKKIEKTAKMEKTITKHPLPTTHTTKLLNTFSPATRNSSKEINTFAKPTPTTRNTTNTLTRPTHTATPTPRTTSDSSMNGSDGFAPVTSAQPSHINTPTTTPRTTGNNTGAVTIP